MTLSKVRMSGWIVGLALSGVACGGGSDPAGTAPDAGTTSPPGTTGTSTATTTATGGTTTAAGTDGNGAATGGSAGVADGGAGGASTTTSTSTSTSTSTTSAPGTACGAGLTPTVHVTTAAQLADAVTNAASGDVIALQAGTYLLPGVSLKLAASNVKIFGPAGRTILDYQATGTTDNKYGIDITGSSNTVCGLTIARARDNGIHITGSGNTIDRCEFFECFDTGLQISGPEAETTPHPANNLILNCDSHDNYDTSASGGNADGFAAKINIGPGNRFYGCVAHDNSDDGWDTYPKTVSGTNPVTIENSVAYHNGYHNGTRAGNGNGFKVGSNVTGGANHVLQNCVAFDNPSKGLDQNHNQGVSTVQHCTAVNNSRNVAFSESGGANITDTVATGEWEQAGGTDTGNVKDAATTSFIHLTPSSMSRDADGTLHLNGFAVYTPSSAGAHF